MCGAIPVISLYVFMVWTHTFILTMSSDLFDMAASLLEYTKEECRDL